MAWSRISFVSHSGVYCSPLAVELPRWTAWHWNRFAAAIRLPHCWIVPPWYIMSAGELREIRRFSSLIHIFYWKNRQHLMKRDNATSYHRHNRSAANHHICFTTISRESVWPWPNTDQSPTCPIYKRWEPTAFYHLYWRKYPYHRYNPDWFEICHLPATYSTFCDRLNI